MRRSTELKVFAAPLVLIAIVTLTLSSVMQFSETKYYMYMMFAGILSAQIDLAVAWLVFGAGSYWLRLPLIAVLALAISFILSYTFPSSAPVWLGVQLIRIPCIGVPLLFARFRGAQLVHVSDPPGKKLVSFQFSLASLLTLFTTTAIYLFAGRFALFPREDIDLAVVYLLAAVVSLMAMAAAFSRHRTLEKLLVLIVSTVVLAFVPEALGAFSFGPLGMMLGALIASVTTTILVLRMMGYSVEWLTRGEVNHEVEPQGSE